MSEYALWTGNQILPLIKLTPLVVALWGCGSELPPPEPAPPPQKQSAEQQRLVLLWTRSCARCHVDGKGGAPRVGHRGDWMPRLGQDMDTLVRNTMEGMNDMPPLGYCTSCQEADFRALIEFMIADISPPGAG